MQRSVLCRSRRELSNESLLAKIGVDTAENEPLEVWGGKFNSIFIRLLGKEASPRSTPVVPVDSFCEAAETAELSHAALAA